jgi:Tfp pilus assembly protein PilP
MIIQYPIAILALLLTVGCSNQSDALPAYVSEARKPNSTAPQYLKREQGSENLIVLEE